MMGPRFNEDIIRKIILDIEKKAKEEKKKKKEEKKDDNNS